MSTRRVRKQDALLIYTMNEVFLKPYEEMSHLTQEAKLYMAFGYPYREIFKRKILVKFKLVGEWWGSIPETVKTSHPAYFNKNHTLYCYVREDRVNYVDIEIKINVGRTSDKGKFNCKTEWHTCRVSKKDYQGLDKVLGPRESVCVKPLHKGDERC